MSETLRRAMEPFFTTKGLGKGTGLGLSMVHGFAEQSGGRFVLRSRQGEGTTAELWLPAAKAPTQPVDARHSPHPVPAETAPVAQSGGSGRRRARSHEHGRACSRILVTPFLRHFPASKRSKFSSARIPSIWSLPTRPCRT